MKCILQMIGLMMIGLIFDDYKIRRNMIDDYSDDDWTHFCNKTNHLKKFLSSQIEMYKAFQANFYFFMTFALFFIIFHDFKGFFLHK